MYLFLFKMQLEQSNEIGKYRIANRKILELTLVFFYSFNYYLLVCYNYLFFFFTASTNCIMANMSDYT